MIEKRLSIRLNLEKLSHKKADEILAALPKRRKSEYIVNAIIMADRYDDLSIIVKEAVNEALSELSISKADTGGDIENVAVDYLSSLKL